MTYEKSRQNVQAGPNWALGMFKELEKYAYE
jgi:hypothetical protein